jgi:hypothetical protein
LPLLYLVKDFYALALCGVPVKQIGLLLHQNRQRLIPDHGLPFCKKFPDALELLIGIRAFDGVLLDAFKKF